MISLQPIPEGTLYRCTMAFFTVTAYEVKDGKRSLERVEIHSNEFLLSTGQVIEGSCFVFYLPSKQVNVGIVSSKLRDYFREIP